LSLRGEALTLSEAARQSFTAPRPSAIVLLEGDPAIVAQGDDLRRCPSSGSCKWLARLPGDVRAVAKGAHGFWYALGGSAGGVYRAGVSDPAAVTPMVLGDVLALCPADDGSAWAAVSRGADLRLVALDGSAPTVSLFELGEAWAMAAGAQTPLEAWSRLLTVARGRGLANVVELAQVAAVDERPLVRSLAAEVLASDTGRSTAVLWQLAHDPHPEVRAAAFAAVERRCKNAFVPACEGLAGMFLRDPDPDIAWSARDLLLVRAPKLALLDAPKAYKLDAIAVLTIRLEREGYATVQEPIMLLAGDADPEVRHAARLLSGVFEQ
jgi:hypothetical protein